jgi:hypothetical protein
MRELPSKLTGLLSRGVSRARLWGALQLWRVTYRLTRLAIVKTSATAGYFEGAASPPFRLGDEFTPTHVLILKILNQEGRLALESVGAGAAVLKAQQKAGSGQSPTKPIVVTDPLAAAAFLREHASTMKKGDQRHFQFPDGSVGSLEAGRRLREGGRVTTGHLFVGGLPGQGGSYNDIAVAAAAGVPAGLHGPLQLLDVVEMARSNAAVSMIAGRDKLVEHGEATLPDFYRQSQYVSGERRPTVGGSYGPSHVGATAAQRGVAIAVGEPPAEALKGTGTRGSRYFQATRQVGLARDLVLLEMSAESLNWLAEGAFEAYVRNRFRQRLQMVLARQFPVLQAGQAV